MSLTYDEILASMKTAFQEEKGETVKNLSDLEMRFKAVASEIYSVFAFGDYVLKQGFPQTATGDYLERHGALRGITRKTASPATGTLTFSLSEARDLSVTIPAGTVCSVSGKPFIQFATDKAATIRGGYLSVQVTATALKPGEEHNVPAGAVTTIVNPPAFVFSVTNEQAFTGGSDPESDESLRERIVSSYGNGRNMLSVTEVRNILLSIEEITDATVWAEANYSMHVCLKTKSGAISNALQTKIKELLGFAHLCSIELVFTAAAEQPFNAFVEAKIYSGYDETAIVNAVKERITQFCSGEKIGQNYSESAAAAACSGIEGLEYVDVFFGSEDSGTVACSSESYLKLRGIEVTAHE